MNKFQSKFNEYEAFRTFKRCRNYIRQFYPNELITECILKLNQDYSNNIKLLIRYQPWHLLLIIKWTILYGDYSSPDRKTITLNRFNKLINLLNDLNGKMRLPAHYSNYFLFFKTLSFQQFWLQENPTYSRIGRQKLLFGYLNQNHKFNLQFEETTLVTINDFIEISLLILSKFREPKEGVFISVSWFKNIYQTYPQDTVQNVLDLLSKDFKEIKTYLKNLTSKKEKISKEYYEQTPLKRYPLLRMNGKYLCYSPKVLYYSIQNFVYDWLKEINPESFMNKFGSIFEKYVNSLIEYSGFSYLTEKNLIKLFGTNFKPIDFLIQEKDAFILIDAKGVEMSSLGKVSHQAEIIKNQTKNAVIKGIEQGFETITKIRESDEFTNIQARKKNIFLILITYKDLYIGNGNDLYNFIIREKLDKLVSKFNGKAPIKMSNIYLISIDDFELLIEYLKKRKIELSKFLLEVIENDSKPETKKLLLRQHLREKDSNIKSPKLISDEFEKLFSKFQKVLINTKA